MPTYEGPSGYAHGELPKIGVLVSNLGTPDAPEPAALRRYLREFLWDPRVIEMSRPLWWLILHLAVLPTRPARSAALYRNVWTEEGSPLLFISRRQTEGLAEILAREVAAPVRVELGMRYGNPSIPKAMAKLAAEGCRKLLVLPLYPQYFAATTGTTFDAVAQVLAGWRFVPDVRFVGGYADEPGYIAALADSIRERWQAEGEPGHLLFSFHGIPERYFRNGDPYHCLCHQTARLVAECLGLPRERYTVAFQSRFGREEWLKPYTDKTVAALARSGVKRLDIINAGFSADCLETIDEIDRENREIFLHHGGEAFRYIAALNDRPDHLRLLADLVKRNVADWIEGWNGEEAARQAVLSKRLADEMAARPRLEDAGFGKG